MVALHAETPAQEERRTSQILQRPNHWAGEEVRVAEVPVSPGEKAIGQTASADWETSQNVVPKQKGKMEAT